MQIGVESSRAVDNKRVFVVDDDEITRAILQFMLHDENETHELADIDAALRKAAQQGAPDIILLGEGMLRQHSMGLLASLKSHFTHAKLMVVLTDKTDPLAAQARQQGADDILFKPLTVETTRKQVDRLLGRHTRSVIPIYAG
jgi:DNA-binding NtrC family response regulator